MHASDDITEKYCRAKWNKSEVVKWEKSELVS